MESPINSITPNCRIYRGLTVYRIIQITRQRFNKSKRCSRKVDFNIALKAKCLISVFTVAPSARIKNVFVARGNKAVFISNATVGLLNARGIIGFFAYGAYIR